jgi:hypothetical protein
VNFAHVSAHQKKPAVVEKVGECLHRLASTGRMYARVWVRSKEIRRSLETSDWQLAKRRLRDSRKELEKLDQAAPKTALKACLETFLASSQNKSQSTRLKFEAIAKRRHEDWPEETGGMLQDAKPSDVLR